MSTKCFGIISWFPDKEPARTQRQERINRLFKQLNDLWPEYPILVITQNWKTFTPVKTNNKLVRVDFKEGLGILKARQTLRKEFLKRNYEYIIMLDDDAIIKATQKARKEYMEALDTHPNGFSFIHGNSNAKYNPYAAAQLNLCAISKNILEHEDIPNVDPQKNQGYEDFIFATLLHHKYRDNEFNFPSDIYCTQFQNKSEVAPSTWATNVLLKQNKIWENSEKIADHILKYKELPNLKIFFEYGIITQKNKDENDWWVKQQLQKQKEKKKTVWPSVI